MVKRLQTIVIKKKIKLEGKIHFGRKNQIQGIAKPNKNVGREIEIFN
jgi:hypothetical protein